MPNNEHLAILKQGVPVWNDWRRRNRILEADLSDADLAKADLSNANLSGVDLTWANLRESWLMSIDFSRALLGGADMTKSVLTEVNFRGADLNRAKLSGANLRSADFTWANLTGADLHGADLTNVTLGYSILADVDLGAVKKLDTINHVARSFLGIDTIHNSEYSLPTVFLRGVGVPENLIQMLQAQVGQSRHVESFSCVITHAGGDQEFADRLYADLQDNGIRCWLAPDNRRLGDKFRTFFEEPMQLHGKLLLVLSQNSVPAKWLEEEVESAFDKERLLKERIIVPVRLDSVMVHTTQPWAVALRRTRQIRDMSEWQTPLSYQKELARLLHDLRSEPQEIS